MIALYSVAGEGGAMVVGNPCDDWNWMEELNRFMDVPRNHPGAFADVGFEHDSYDCALVDAGPKQTRATFVNRVIGRMIAKRDGIEDARHGTRPVTPRARDPTGAPQGSGPLRRQ